MDRTGVVRVLDQVASLLELKGENPFRVRAFRTAARTISSGTGDLTAALDDGSLAAARGIGPAILQIVTDLVRNGRSRVFEELRDEVPPVLLEMLAISGLGVAKVRLIHEQLGIDSLTELEDAARDGRLAKLPGFGPRSAENVLRGLAFLRRQNSTLLVHHAAREAEEARAALARLKGVSRAIVAGDVRRGTEVAREIVLTLARPGRTEAQTEILAVLAVQLRHLGPVVENARPMGSGPLDDDAAVVGPALHVVPVEAARAGGPHHGAAGRRLIVRARAGHGGKRQSNQGRANEGHGCALAKHVPRPPS